jgi:hypothetical protein
MSYLLISRTPIEGWVFFLAMLYQLLKLAIPVTGGGGP